jgi:hypothetical protein
MLGLGPSIHALFLILPNGMPLRYDLIGNCGARDVVA